MPHHHTGLPGGLTSCLSRSSSRLMTSLILSTQAWARLEVLAEYLLRFPRLSTTTNTLPLVLSVGSLYLSLHSLRGILFTFSLPCDGERHTQQVRVEGERHTQQVRVC